ILMRLQQRVDPLPKCRIPSTGGVQEGHPLAGAVLFQGFEKNGAFVHEPRSPHSPAARLYRRVRKTGWNHATIGNETTGSTGIRHSRPSNLLMQPGPRVSP